MTIQKKLKVGRWGRIVLALLLAFGAIIGNLAVPAERAEASSAENVYLGEIRLFPYAKAPAGWVYSDGRLLNIQQNTAVYALLGTKYGGDGRTTFALPNLRGASPIAGTAYYIAMNGMFPSSDANDSFASVGEVKLFPYSRNMLEGAWLKADGSTVSSATYPQLYSRIGNRYGGDASGFVLPNLKNPAPFLADGLYYAIAAKSSGDPNSDYVGALVSTVVSSPSEPEWAPTNGRLLSIYEYQALFALIGTKFGGNGQSSFGLPNIPTDSDGVSYYMVLNGIFPMTMDSPATPNEARAVSDSYQVAGSQTLSVPFQSGVLRNDTDASGVRLFQNPSHGSLTLNPDGSFAYTASGGYRGQDSFVYQAYGPNGDGSTATVTLQVNPAVAVISGVSDGAYYKNDVTVVFTDGNALLDGQPFQSGNKVSAEGMHILQVTNDAGTVTRSFTLDKTAPVVTGVENGNMYRSAPAISFNEGTATLNGASFTSGTSVTTDGSYTLVVTDQAGNATTVTFTVNRNMTVTFETNGGSALSPQTVLYGEHAARPTEPTRTGHTFDDWYEDALLTKPFDFASQAVTADMTLYAGWTVNRYTVDFETNAVGVTVPSQEILYNAKATQPAAPTRTGYTFAGWYADAGLSQPFDFAAMPITQDTTVYARWTINTYAVSFDSQGGTAVSAQTVEHGAKASEPNPAPTRVGYTFGGWFKDRALTQPFDFSSATVTSSLLLYAKWTINEYEVSFDSEGGTAVASQKVEHGNQAAEPAQEPKRTGYTFGGWYADEALTQPFAFDKTGITGDLTLHAKWTINRYQVAFDSEGGSAVETQTVDYGSQAVEPVQEPTRVGYTFGGWYTDATLKERYEFADTPITGDVTLHAKWMINAYDVTFDSEGGTAVETQQVEYGGLVSEPTEEPTRTGYTFGGWYADEALTQKFDFDKTDITGDLTLHAKWTINRYEVAFDSEGGSAVVTQTVEYGKTASTPADEPTRIGHTFDGWYADEKLTESFDFAGTPITGDTTIYAKWTLNRYTVSFDSEQGTPIDAQAIDYGRTAAEPIESPTRTGYTFGGWYASASSTEPFDFAQTLITGDLTLHAKWTINVYDVAFDSNGGSAVDAQAVEHGSLASEPAQQPARTGYTFGGWYADDKLTQAFSFVAQPIVGDTVVYAKWTPIPYTLTFDSNQGTTVDAQTIDYGQKAAEPQSPTREGYTFGGWYADAALSRTFDFAADPIVGNTTVYAKWNPILYKVTFDSEQGTAVKGQTVEHGQKAVEPAPPTRAGYTFGGWYEDAALSRTFDFASTLVLSDLTLHAKWTAIPVVLTPTSPPSSGGGGGGAPSTPAVTPTPASSAPVVSTNGKLTLAVGQAGEVSFGGAAKIVIPAGAADRELTIDIVPIEDPSALLSEGQNLIGPVLEMNKNFKENFKKPIELTLKMDETRLLPGQKAAISYYNETSGVWVEVPGTKTQSGSATVSVDHFTKFAVFGVDPKPASAISFSDTTGHWAQAAIEQAASLGFVHGYADGTFKPGASVTRAEFAAMLAGALSLPAASGELDFADTAKIGAWAKPAIASAAAAGVIHGYTDGTFRPNAVVTRAEMAVMLAAALKLPASGSAAAFADAASIPAWAAGAAEALRAAGWMSGKSGGVFDADGRASRAEAVQLLVNAVGAR